MLYLRKPWARWFTIIATSSLIPIEVYEIVRKPDLTRVLVLAANVAIVAYLAAPGRVRAVTHPRHLMRDSQRASPGVSHHELGC